MGKAVKFSAAIVGPFFLGTLTLALTLTGSRVEPHLVNDAPSPDRRFTSVSVA
jgi:hypothetical protein